MKKITIDTNDNDLKEIIIEDGKFRNVKSYEVKPSKDDSLTKSIKSSDAHDINGMYSKEIALDNIVASGNKTGLGNGDLSDRISDYLIEKGYKR